MAMIQEEKRRQKEEDEQIKHERLKAERWRTPREKLRSVIDRLADDAVLNGGRQPRGWSSTRVLPL